MSLKTDAIIAAAVIAAIVIGGFYAYNKIKGLSFGQAVGQTIANTALQIPQEIISTSYQAGQQQAEQEVMQALSNLPITPAERSMGWVTPPQYSITNQQAFNAYQEASQGLPGGISGGEALFANIGTQVLKFL